MRIMCFIVLLAFCLAGCTVQNPEQTTAAATQPTEATQLQEEVLYMPDSKVEQISNGALRSYTVGECEEFGLLPLQDGFLLITIEKENGQLYTNLKKLEGQDLLPVHSARLEGAYYPSLWQIHEDGVLMAYYDLDSKMFEVFDGTFQPTKTIPLPEGGTDSVLLTRDFSKIYYCTDTAIRVLDVELGIDKPLRQGSEANRSLMGFAFEETALQIVQYGKLENESILLDAQTGETIYSTVKGWSRFYSGETSYFLHRVFRTDEYIFGTWESEPQQLILPSDCVINDVQADQGRVIVSFWNDKNVCLECYDLTTGQKTAQIELPETYFPGNIRFSEDGTSAWLVDNYSKSLLQWDMEGSAVSDGTSYIVKHYTQDWPDLDRLQQCQLRADSIGQAFGIDILLWDETQMLTNDSYGFITDYHPELYTDMLDQLESAIQKLPEGFLQQVSSWDNAHQLTIALVYDIVHQSGDGVVDAAGVQYWDDTRNYIVLEYSDVLETAFFRELYRVIDVAILNTTTVYDEWTQLNPGDFSYVYSYIVDSSVEDSEWMTGEDPAFLDVYSMSYPTDDRASVFANAFAPDNRFTTSILQSKLQAICKALRKTFELPETVQWEQYLVK